MSSNCRKPFRRGHAAISLPSSTVISIRPVTLQIVVKPPLPVSKIHGKSRLGVDPPNPLPHAEKMDDIRLQFRARAAGKPECLSSRPVGMFSISHIKSWRHSAPVLWSLNHECSPPHQCPPEFASRMARGAEKADPEMSWVLAASTAASSKTHGAPSQFNPPTRSRPNTLQRIVDHAGLSHCQASSPNVQTNDSCLLLLQLIRCRNNDTYSPSLLFPSASFYSGISIDLAGIPVLSRPEWCNSLRLVKI
ncbi:hypothetical protein DFH06DRAFT_1141491 [Mycena polygramma]|nr:hypothetical protein DFH06DRAFT_1141491 [Mycena polygramma]